MLLKSLNEGVGEVPMIKAHAYSPLKRKKYIFAASVGAMLAIFSLLAYSNNLYIPTPVVILIQCVLLVAFILPLVVPETHEDRELEQSLALFANLKTPAVTSHKFKVPSLPKYQKLRLMPTRIATLLIILIAGVAVGSPPLFGMMITNDVQPNVILGIIILIGIAFAFVFGMFVTYTIREIVLRNRFHQEVMEGIISSGYKPVRDFNTEDMGGSSMLLCELDDDIYTWWDIDFSGDEAVLEWDESKRNTHE